MSAPVPVLHVPTFAAKQAALIALYGAGYSALRLSLPEALANAQADEADYAPYPYMWVRLDKRDQILLDDAAFARVGARHTKVNSISHMVAYVGRHSL